MPKAKHRNKKQQWNPGFQRDNRQNVYKRDNRQNVYNSYQNFQGNMSQNYNNSYSNKTNNYTPNVSTNYYGHSSFQTNYTQNYRNNHSEQGFHRNFPQIQGSHNQNVKYHNLNFEHSNFTNGDFNPNFQKNIIQQSNDSSNNFIAQCNTNQNDSITNTKINTIKSNNKPRIKNPPIKRKRCHKKDLGLKYLQDYDNKTEIFTDKGYILKESLYRDPSLFKASNKSLLQKMIWHGRHLGKTTDDIVEPIAPKAVNTKKHKPVKPKEPTPFAFVANRKFKHPKLQDNFFTNLLLYILEFVRNDEEIKIVFEPRLRTAERRRIDLIVKKLRESDNLKDFNNFKNFSWSDKHFELIKEIWMYNCYELWTENKGDDEHFSLHYLSKEAPAHVYLVTPENLTEKKESNIIDDKNGKDNEQIQNNDKYNEIMEENDKINVKNEINSLEEFTDMNKCDAIKEKMELKIDEKDSIAGEVISDNARNINIKQEIDKNKEYIKKGDEKDATNSILAKLVKYFKVFSSVALFKEFRFLGPFDSHQKMHIEMFFNICMKVDEIQCNEKMELLAAFDNDLVKFDVLEDNNGKRFIRKVAESPKLPSADDDVTCIS